jgi:hypothetical protein
MAFRTLAALAAAALLATPAMAQSGWTQYQSGNQTHYNGTGDAAGWSGYSYQSGSQTNTNFSGPNGQMHTCTSYRMGSQIQTNCN